MASGGRQELGGSNEHADQCSSIPGTLDDTLHGIHMEPCYKKFTMIISKAHAKRKHSTEDVLESGQVKQLRCQRMSLGVNLFPDYCYFCKKKMEHCQRRSTNFPPIDIKHNRGNYTKKLQS